MTNVPNLTEQLRRTSQYRPIRVEVRKKRTFITRQETVDAPEDAQADPSMADIAAAAVESTLELPASEQEDLTGLMAALEDALQDLNAAIEKSQTTSQKIQDLNKDLQARGWWDALKGSLGSSTEKELATQVLALSQSVTTTQEFVRVMLKAQTQKNRVLYAFNDALVSKIANLQGDTHSLNANQQAAALALLGELRQQVEEQIRQRELVQSHEHAIVELEQGLGEVADEHEETSRQLAQVQQSSEALAQRVDSMGQWQASKDQRDGETATQVAALEAGAQALVQRFSGLEEWKRGEEAADVALREQLARSQSEVARLKERIGGLEGRLAAVEAAQSQARSVKALVARQAPAVIALGLAAAAVYRMVAGA